MSYPCLRIDIGYILSSEPVSIESIPDNAYFTKVIPTHGDPSFIGQRLLKISRDSFISATVKKFEFSLWDSFYEGKRWALVTSDFAGRSTFINPPRDYISGGDSD